MVRLVSAVIFILMICLQAFSQDLTVHLTTTRSGITEPGYASSTSDNYYSKNAMRTSSPHGADTIVRFDTRKIITLDSKNKTYTEISFQDLGDVLDKLAPETNDAAGLEQVRKMIGLPDSPSSLTKEGPGEKIAGYPTEKYRLTGPVQMELWAAPALKFPTDYFDVLTFQLPRNPIFNVENVYQAFKKIDCIPLKTILTIKTRDVQMQATTVVDYVETGPLPASMFEVPAGYQGRRGVSPRLP